jgi:outer membrane protein OmpA-like peptidoglycan-associated protein
MSGEAIALAEQTEQKNGVQINEENGFNINTIYFDFDKYAIRADARIELDKLLMWLRENPDMKIEVNAHTDVRGSEKYNQKLSDRRANQTVSYLTDRGIDPMRISGKGFGESQVVERCTEANPCNGLQHQLNRRSEFYLRNPETDAIVFRSRNRTPSLRDENGMYASNSGMYMNYNFYADDQVYTVQVGAFKGKIQTDKYSALKTLFNHRYDDGLNRYYSGTFESAEAARAHLKEMRAKGFTDAFVVKLEGEQRRL